MMNVKLHCKKSWRSSSTFASGDAGPIQPGVRKRFRHPWRQFYYKYRNFFSRLLLVSNFLAINAFPTSNFLDDVLCGRPACLQYLWLTKSPGGHPSLSDPLDPRPLITKRHRPEIRLLTLINSYNHRWHNNTPLDGWWNEEKRWEWIAIA